MRHIISVASSIVLLSFFSCSMFENEVEITKESIEPGVYGYILPIDFGTSDNTKATADPNTLAYIWEIGDRINIWSDTGTLLSYSVESVNENGRASFSGGGFTLTEGKTYYSSHPLILSVKDDYKTLSTSYEGETQSSDNDAAHIADYTYTYSSATCNNGNTSFQYHHLSAFIKFTVTLPEALTLTELTLTADSDVFALNGTADVTTGVFTPGKMSKTMSLKLDNILVTDGVLNASLAVAPFNAGSFVVRVKDIDGNVYTSPEISKDALDAGNGMLFSVEVFESIAIPEIVDLGLSVKWASFNLGATKPEEYGYYYQWGETEPESVSYIWANYKHCMGTSKTLTKYCFGPYLGYNYGYNNFKDNIYELEKIDDAASVHLGDNWRIPTHAEMMELKDNCSLVEISINGVKGVRLTSNVSGYWDKWIFIPYNGEKLNNNVVNSEEMSNLWTSSLVINPEAESKSNGPADARHFRLQHSSSSTPGFYSYPSFRYSGFGIRPVYAE